MKKIFSITLFLINSLTFLLFATDQGSIDQELICESKSYLVESNKACIEALAEPFTATWKTDLDKRVSGCDSIKIIFKFSTEIVTIKDKEIISEFLNTLQINDNINHRHRGRFASYNAEFKILFLSEGEVMELLLISAQSLKWKNGTWNGDPKLSNSSAADLYEFLFKYKVIPSDDEYWRQVYGSYAKWAFKEKKKNPSTNVND